VIWRLDPIALALGLATDGAGASSRALAIHPTNPNVIYIAQGDLTFWRGEFPPAPSTAPAMWTMMPAPPFNYPTVTDSGGAFIIPHMTTEGQLFFFASDRRTVHIAFGEPAVTEGWTRVEDKNCHLDPHGLALTPDFHPWSPDVEVPGFGRALLVNDGGINFSTNGVQSWSNGRGLSTLGIVNIAVNTVPARPAAICLGCGDNFGFASPDGGATWKTQNYLRRQRLRFRRSVPAQPHGSVRAAQQVHATRGRQCLWRDLSLCERRWQSARHRTGHLGSAANPRPFADSRLSAGRLECCQQFRQLGLPPADLDAQW